MLMATAPVEDPRHGYQTSSHSLALDTQAAEEIAQVMKALSDPLRVQMLSYMSVDPRGESCACDFLELTDVSQPTVSHHLRVLRESGLVVSERRGTWVWYRLTPQHRAFFETLVHSYKLSKPMEKEAVNV